MCYIISVSACRGKTTSGKDETLITAESSTDTTTEYSFIIGYSCKNRLQSFIKS